MGIKENLASAKKAIAEAAKKSGRHASEITLVGVSKASPIECVLEAVRAGLSAIGENRLREAEAKFPMLPANVGRHFIGHLQSNKAGKAVEISDIIQSVDSLKIAEKIGGAAAARGKVMPVLIEVLTDASKQFGIPPAELSGFIEKASGLEGIRILGLMTVGPYCEDPEDSRPVFREMKRLFDSVQARNPTIEMRFLSMGMSGDFVTAIEEGANMVRLGKAIFGERREQQLF
jgi:pyridoxal phosphate enzyme (YggS family)